MNGDPGYALQKLELAILDLATGPGDIRSRLKSVYKEHLHIINENDFPDSLKPEWNAIKKALTKKGPLRDEDGEVITGSIDRTLHRMWNKTASKIANNMLVLRDRLEGYLNDIANQP